MMKVHYDPLLMHFIKFASVDEWLCFIRLSMYTIYQQMLINNLKPMTTYISY